MVAAQCPSWLSASAAVCGRWQRVPMGVVVSAQCLPIYGDDVSLRALTTNDEPRYGGVPMGAQCLPIYWG